MNTPFDKYENILLQTSAMKYNGQVKEIRGLLIEGEGPISQLGELCYIYSPDSEGPVRAEVIGFGGKSVLLMAYDEMKGLYPGCQIKATGLPVRLNVSEEMLGRILNGLGDPIDGGPKIVSRDVRDVIHNPMNALKRRQITQPLSVGIKSIDMFLTLGRGQRVGIFSGSGVGKSTLLSMIARNTEAEVIVMGLIGERGREVKEFIENDLGEEGLRRSVVVAATSDDSPLAKIKAACTATTIAEYFRDQGKDVLLLMDSVTRFARAQREIGLAIGEPPAMSGFTPSVFSLIHRVLERAGTTDAGTITGIYTVLLEADDINDPISDAVRGTLDGHISLSRSLAELNQYPAVDVLGSISRLMSRIVKPEQKKLAERIREMMAIHKENYDLISAGAYVEGANPKLDEARKYMDRINNFLRQGIYDKWTYDAEWAEMQAIFNYNENSDSSDNKNVNMAQYSDLLQRMNETL